MHQKGHCELVYSLTLKTVEKKQEKKMVDIVQTLMAVGGVSFHHEILSKQNTNLSNKKDITNTLCPVDMEYLDTYNIEPFITNLPVLMVDTKGQLVAKENSIWGEVGIFDQAENDILKDPDLIFEATIKLRGAFSYYNFDKPQYKIEFYKKSHKKDYDYGLGGMKPNSEWVLNGPFLDKTLVRNALMYDVSRELMDWAPDYRFVEVFVDGKYQGIYLAVENITRHENRLGLSDFGLASGQTAYIMKRDRVGTEELEYDSYGIKNGYTTNAVSVQYPSPTEITKKQLSWIHKDFDHFEKKLFQTNFAKEKFHYEDYIDVDDFVDYYLINEISMNHDAGFLSTFYYKELDGKFKLAVWDFNNAFDNYQGFKIKTYETLMAKADWFNKLCEDQAFVDKVCKRYQELRKTTFSEGHLFGKVREYQDTMGEAVDRNYAIWGYSFQLNLLVDKEVADRDPENYDEAKRQLLVCIHERLNYMDAHIKDLYQNCKNIK